MLSGILKCPMCGSSMYADIRRWKNKDGNYSQRELYQCGHYAKSKFGQCKKNAIESDWIEGEVIAYTKLLVSNPRFAEDIQKRIGQKTDSSEIDNEISNYQKQLNKLERSKGRLEQDIDNIFDDDRNAERKRKDMNNRLYNIYEEIYNIEDLIAGCEQKKAAARKSVLTKENVYRMLLVFDKMNAADKRKVIESLIAEIRLKPKDTWSKDKSPIKEIKYAFPVSEDVLCSLGENVSSVECVVLMSRVTK